MRYIQWDSIFSVGIEELDNQYRKIIDMINALYAAAQAKDRRMMKDVVIARLKHCFGENMATEEQYMLIYHYPDISHHRGEHADFIKNVLEFQETCGDAPVSALATVDFRKEWLIRHVINADRKLGAFLKEHMADRPAAAIPGAVPAIGLWFHLPEEKIHYHQGHSWVMPEGNGMVKVGIDDFARKLVGRIDAIQLPRVGSLLSQGEKGWSLLAGGKSIDMLSPVDGKVVAVNENLHDSPDSVNKDPYRHSWLMKVEAPKISANLKNLLAGGLARKWMEGVRENLLTRMDYNLGAVSQDGGAPVDGIAKSLDRERWDEIAKEFLLVS
jgi:hemerythrin-like metal-binding protein